MTSLVEKGFSLNRECELSGFTKSLLYYNPRKRSILLEQFLESGVYEIISVKPSYSIRRVIATISRSDISVNWKRIKRHMLAMNLPHSKKKRARIKSPSAIVVSTPIRMLETDFTKVYISKGLWIYFVLYIDVY